MRTTPAPAVARFLAATAAAFTPRATPTPPKPLPLPVAAAGLPMLPPIH